MGQARNARNIYTVPCMDTFLGRLAVVCFAANLLWLAVLASRLRAALASALRLERRAAFALGGLTLAAAAAQLLLVSPKHLIFVDEFWYMEAAKNLVLHGGYAPGYFKAIGWPGLIAPVFAVFGFNNFNAIYLSIILGALSVPLAFYAAKRVFGDDTPAFIACALWAFLPQRLIWAATAETMTASVFLILLSSWLTLLAWDKPEEPAFAWLALLGWGLASQVRPENFMLVLVLAAALALARADRSRWTLFLKPALAAAALNLFDWIIFARFQSSTDWTARESAGLLQGGNFSLQNLLRNTGNWMPKLWGWELHPLLLSLAAIAGLYLLFRRNRRAALLSALGYALLHLFYFSSWLASYGSTLQGFPKTKIFLLFYLLLCFWAAYALSLCRWKGLSKLPYALALALLLNFVPYYAKYPLRSVPHELEATMLSQLRYAVPQGCVVVANSALVVNSVNFFTVLEADVFLKNDELRLGALNSGCVVFVEDLTCSFSFESIGGNCARIKKEYELEKAADFRQGAAEFAVWRFRP